MCQPRDAVSRRALLAAALTGATALAAGCATGTTPASQGSASSPAAPPPSTGGPTQAQTPTPSPTPATAREIIARATVPVLCYHQVRPYEAGDTEYNRQLLIVEPAAYRAQLDAIKKAGYTTIGPAEYHAHLTTGAALPDKPVMLSFDDGKDNQPEVALAELLDRDMTGTWFIMTVVVGNPGWTTAAQIKQAADAGITIGCHTWDHHDVRKYTGKDYTTQFDEARATLQKHSGQPVDSFAYPYGAWKPDALPHLRDAGFTTAFQLDEKPLDPTLPQYTLKRSLTASGWTGPQVVAKLDELSA